MRPAAMATTGQWSVGTIECNDTVSRVRRLRNSRIGGRAPAHQHRDEAGGQDHRSDRVHCGHLRAMLIASQVVEGFDAQHARLYASLLTIGYMISRLANSGSRD